VEQFNKEELNVIVSYFKETLNLCYKHNHGGPGRVENIHMLPNDEFDEEIPRESIDCVKSIIAKGIEAIGLMENTCVGNCNADGESCD